MGWDRGKKDQGRCMGPTNREGGISKLAHPKKPTTTQRGRNGGRKTSRFKSQRFKRSARKPASLKRDVLAKQKKLHGSMKKKRTQGKETGPRCKFSI